MRCWIVNNMDECDCEKCPKDKTKTVKCPATSEEIFDELMKQKRWGFPAGTKYLNKLSRGDRIIFRRGKFKEECDESKRPKFSSGKYFVGTAIIKSNHPKPIDTYKNFRMIGYHYTGVMIIELEKIHIFRNPVEMADKLSFVKNKDRYGGYYQGSIRPCPPADCEKILKLNK